jgi:diketogulonate reductase-like aldo/keto reductase
MMNCPTTPPPPPVPEGEEEKEPVKRQSMMVGWKVLEQCREKGLCKSIGLANFTIQAILMMFPFVNVKPTVNEIECHPFNIQRNMVQLCKKLGITPIAYCPLLRGGKDQKQPLGDKIDYLAEPSLKELSTTYAKSIPQILLNYQICRGVAVVPKTEKLDHLRDNFNITDFQLQ